MDMMKFLLLWSSAVTTEKSYIITKRLAKFWQRSTVRAGLYMGHMGQVAQGPRRHLSTKIVKWCLKICLQLYKISKNFPLPLKNIKTLLPAAKMSKKFCLRRLKLKKICLRRYLRVPCPWSGSAYSIPWGPKRALKNGNQPSAKSVSKF